MQATYKKTQTGWIIVLSCIPALVFLSWVIYYQEVLGKAFGDKPAPSLVYWGIILLLLAFLALFSNLTVTGFPTYLEMKYGIGLVRKKFEYTDIKYCSVKKNRWFYGWGVRKIPGGWLYNVSGLWCVQIDMKNGKMYQIGTPEPEKLVEFIKSRMSLFGS
jgi:hypothetical protein